MGSSSGGDGDVTATSLGFAAEEQDAAVPHGVRLSVKISSLTSVGWKLHYSAPYSSKMRAQDLDPGPAARWLLFGARPRFGDTLVIAAACQRDVALQRTWSKTDGAYSNGAFWYNVSVNSANASFESDCRADPPVCSAFGFSPVAAVNITSSGDISHGRDDRQRLSWLVDSSAGGARAGKDVDLNFSHAFEKVVFYLP